MLVLAADRSELGELEGEVVGVGPVVAGIRAAALLEAHRPDRVVLIGTAGAYGPELDLGSAIVSRRLGLSWGVAALGLGYVPRPPEPIDGDLELIAMVDLPSHTVLTVGAITTDPGLTQQLSDGWAVEHLEAFAVAYACREARVPFAAVLGIANRVGPDAHAQWLTHRDAAQRAARDAVRRVLGA